MGICGLLFKRTSFGRFKGFFFSGIFVKCFFFLVLVFFGGTFGEFFWCVMCLGVLRSFVLFVKIRLVTPFWIYGLLILNPLEGKGFMFPNEKSDYLVRIENTVRG